MKLRLTLLLFVMTATLYTAAQRFYADEAALSDGMVIKTEKEGNTIHK